MSEMMEIPVGTPLRDAWEQYKETADYANTRDWILHPGHVDGSLWAAFAAGYKAREELEGEQGAPDETQSAEAQRDIARLNEYLLEHGLLLPNGDAVRSAILLIEGVWGAAPVPAMAIAELQRARQKFPTWPTDPIHAATIVSEEAGELAQAALQSVYEPGKKDLSHALVEALQVAAMAMRWAQNISNYTTAAAHQIDDCKAEKQGKS